MKIVKSDKGFEYTTVKICEVCNTQVATVCLRFEDDDLNVAKLSPNRYYCEYCNKR